MPRWTPLTGTDGAGPRSDDGTDRAPLVADGGPDEDRPSGAPTEAGSAGEVTQEGGPEADETATDDHREPPASAVEPGGPPADDPPTDARRDDDGFDWRRLRPVLAMPAGLLEGALTIVAGWLFVGMVFLFEVGSSIESFEAEVGAPGDTVLGAALQAFSTEEFLLGVAKLITWVFAGAHQVAIEVDAPDMAGSVNVVTELAGTGGWVTPIVYQAIPPVLLLYGGYQLARAKTGTTTLRSVSIGAMIAIGYAIGVGILALVAGIDDGGLSVGPDPITFVLLGAVYGMLFGGLGGLVAAALHRS